MTSAQLLQTQIPLRNYLSLKDQSDKESVRRMKKEVIDTAERAGLRDGASFLKTGR